MLLALSQQAFGISLALDSVATWGKFPRFVVNTYRWGDNFFNSYDSAYVVGTGCKFNVKATADSWFDYYNFTLQDNQTMHLRSDPSTSFGLHLTYLAVSVGYDVNMQKLLHNDERVRKRFRFGFNCSLLAVELNYSDNDVGTTLTRFGKGWSPTKVNIKFNGINTSILGLDGYYFFNNKRYSEAASFNFSKIQKRSQGSLYAGFSLYRKKYDFDFNELPDDIKNNLPEKWKNDCYHVESDNYAVRMGYGYNWVLGPKWVVGISESPIVGISKGYINSDEKKTSFSLYNRFKASAVWNSGKWFAGVVGKIDLAVCYEKESTLANALFCAEACIGYRFNLW
jgi:hypothetical protein